MAPPAAIEILTAADATPTEAIITTKEALVTTKGEKIELCGALGAFTESVVSWTSSIA